MAAAIRLPAFAAALLGLALNYAAYESEIYRSALEAVSAGQLEARMTGVVNTTSPISRSLSNRIFTRYAREECSTSNGQCRNAWTSSRRTLDHCILRVEH